MATDSETVPAWLAPLCSQLKSCSTVEEVASVVDQLDVATFEHIPVGKAVEELHRMGSAQCGPLLELLLSGLSN